MTTLPTTPQDKARFVAAAFRQIADEFREEGSPHLASQTEGALAGTDEETLARFYDLMMGFKPRRKRLVKEAPDQDYRETYTFSTALVDHWAEVYHQDAEEFFQRLVDGEIVRVLSPFGTPVFLSLAVA